MSDPLAIAVTQHLHRVMHSPGSHDQLSRELLRIAANYRLEVLRPRIRAMLGDVVASGLFEGMHLLPQASEGCMIPKLLGCYEAPLQPHLRALAATKPAIVLNIGCAEGWYAVGCARLLPDAEVHAFDIDANARTLCASMAALNGVADRIRLGGRFSHADFSTYDGQRILLLCDIEGAEQSLLDPVEAPALRTIDMIVEAHDNAAAISTVLKNRFGPTHDIIQIDSFPMAPSLPRWLTTQPEIDQLLALWEMRRDPTPWLVCRAKS